MFRSLLCTQITALTHLENFTWLFICGTNWLFLGTIWLGTNGPDSEGKGRRDWRDVNHVDIEYTLLTQTPTKIRGQINALIRLLTLYMDWFYWGLQRFRWVFQLSHEVPLDNKPDESPILIRGNSESYLYEGFSVACFAAGPRTRLKKPDGLECLQRRQGFPLIDWKVIIIIIIIIFI